MSTTLSELQDLRKSVYALRIRSELTDTAKRELIGGINSAIDSLIMPATSTVTV